MLNNPKEAQKDQEGHYEPLPTGAGFELGNAEGLLKQMSGKVEKSIKQLHERMTMLVENPMEIPESRGGTPGTDDPTKPVVPPGDEQGDEFGDETGKKKGRCPCCGRRKKKTDPAPPPASKSEDHE